MIDGRNSIDSMRKLIIVGAFPPPVHGQSSVNQEVLNAVKARFQIVVVNLSPGSFRRNIIYYTRRIFNTIGGALTIMRHAFGANQRVLYLSTDSGLGIVLNLVVVGVGRILNYSLFLHHHSYSYITRKSTWMALLKRVAGPRARHVYLCEEMRARYEALYGFANVPIICSNGRFAPSARPRTTLFCGGALRIGLLSNLCAEKGLYDFLQILDSAKNDDLELRGVLAGPPVSSFDAVEIEKAQLRLGKSFTYLGPVYGRAKDDFFDQIDVFVFPTRYAVESYGIVVVEALARGIPVIAYGRGCIASYLKTPAGIVVAPERGFLECALPVLVEWRRNPDAYRLASEAASSLSRSLREESEKGFNELIAALVEEDRLPQL